jgi:methionyl-tRNA formyltransferase
MHRIVFFGTPDFAVPSLKKLSGVVAVVTSPDKPVGRKQVLTPSPVKVAATDLGLPVLTPATLKDENFLAQFSNLEPDLCVVVAYGKLIPQKYLDVPRLGFVNIHPSLLPKYRGPSPIQSAILNGETETGVSIMLVDAEMDHGPVLAQEPWTIPSGFDAVMAENELSRVGAELLVRTLSKYANGAITPQPQDDSVATFTKKFTREDGKLDWSRPATETYNRIRALSANPGTWTVVGGKTLNILSAHMADGKVVPDRVQLEGGKPMDWQAFLRGHPATVLQ